MAYGLERGRTLVIGGSGGVGAVICRMLAAEGANVTFTYNGNRARAESLSKDLGGAAFSQLNAGDSEAVRALIEEVTQDGELHRLIYAAGPLVPQIHLSKTTPEQMRDFMTQDALGFFNLCHYALPHLRRHRGSVTALQSCAQWRWAPADGLSVVPKSAVNAIMKGIAREEGRYGVRANGVALGVIETGSHTALMESGDIDRNWMEHATRNIALRQMGAPEDVAEAVLWLASDRAKYVTGEVIKVDGGFHLG